MICQTICSALFWALMTLIVALCLAGVIAMISLFVEIIKGYNSDLDQTE